MRPAAFIEVSHPVEPGIGAYPCLLDPRAEVLLDYEASRGRYRNQSKGARQPKGSCAITESPPRTLGVFKTWRS
jgi:hypothetical protein